MPIRLDALKESRAEPTSVLRRIVRRTAYSDRHPYGWRGDEETLPVIRRPSSRTSTGRIPGPTVAG